MPDKIFFPLMLAVMAGMVWIASWRPADACPTGSVSAANTDYVTVRISGTQLNRFVPKDGLEISPCKADMNYILGLRATKSVFPPSPDAGPHFRLAPDIEVAFAGHIVRITVRARAAPENGATGFEVNYFTGPEGASGWRSFPLSATFEDHTLEYSVPPASQAQGVDFLGIRPLVTDGADGLEIESVTFVNTPL